MFFSHSFAPGKHRLAASLDVAQVHQHSRDSLAAVLDVFVIREVIEVRIVLLSALVAQDLDALAVIDRDHRERGDALLDASHDIVFGSAYEVAGARAHVARFWRARLLVHHGRDAHPRPRHLDEMVALLWC